MNYRPYPQTAFILSLIGGILMLIGGGIMWIIFGGMPYYWMMGMYHMPGAGYPYAFMSWMFIIGIVSGIIVLIGAWMLRSNPEQHYTWGILILIISIIGLFGMGGFFIGALLGIAGGALSLNWRPARSASKY